MLFCRNILSVAINSLSRCYSTTSQNYFKMTILGSAGNIGQILAFYMSQNCLVTELALYDIAKINPGVAVDISHMNSVTAKVKAYTGGKELFYAINGAHVIVIAAGSPKKLNQSQHEFMTANGNIIFFLSWFIASHWPYALICVLTDPINITVPIVSEIMDIFKVYDPKKIFGITAIDMMRAASFLSIDSNTDPCLQFVPVIGGHEGKTVVPLISQMVPPLEGKLPEPYKDMIVRDIQNAENNILEAKKGAGTSSLASALAASRFLCTVLRGLAGDPGAVDIAYVRSDCTDAKYFATPIQFSCHGLYHNFGIPKGLNDFELYSIERAVQQLKKDIETGENFVACKFETLDRIGI